MAETEKRNLKQIGKQWCQQYMERGNAFHLNCRHRQEGR